MGFYKTILKYAMAKHDVTQKTMRSLIVVKEIDRMTNRNVRFFIMVCRKTKLALKIMLYGWAKRYYGADNVIDGDGFLYIKGTDKILLTAHMDTVHLNQCKVIDVKHEKGKMHLSSKDGIGGDDRCGIYMIMRIVESTKLRPSILFCEDEEIGGIGSGKFVKTEYVKDLNEMLFLIELDRAHDNDLVFYRDGNKEFQEFCKKTTGYLLARGTFSDICNLSPACEVSSVNISCGYYNPHRLNEYVVFEEMENSIKQTIALITDGLAQGKQYKYEKSYLNYYGYGNGYYNSYNYGYERCRTYSDYYGHGGIYSDESPYITNSKDTLKNNSRNSASNSKYCYEFRDDRNYLYYGYGNNFKEALGDMITKNEFMTYSRIVDIKCYSTEESALLSC
jgi:hypothetical protein